MTRESSCTFVLFVPFVVERFQPSTLVPGLVPDAPSGIMGRRHDPGVRVSECRQCLLSWHAAPA
jgi:hypothetical protein